MKTAIIMGTRPEIIKLSPVIRLLNKKNCTTILTGQHYNYNLSSQFIQELGIRKPDFSMKIKRSNPSEQISEIIVKLSKILAKTVPDTLVVQGDTNTVLAAGITSLKSGIPISHIESGLRSFDWRMPEEHNRIAVDHISELLFAPTQNAKKNLVNEHVHGRIFVTGNTVIDAVNKFASISAKKSHISFKSKDFVLLTLHRSENVDNRKILSSILKGILNSNEKVIFPIHPRTLKRLHQFDLYNKLKNSSNIVMMRSVGYFDMLELMKNCSFIVSDSGGIQEEATSPKIRKKVLVVRKTTDRPEAVKAGIAQVVGLEHSKISSAIRKTSRDAGIYTKSSPYGKGDAAKKIIKIINKIF